MSLRVLFALATFEHPLSIVMAGLDPAIHILASCKKDVDHRDEPGDDGGKDAHRAE
jgi:hypothetical protein